MKALLPVLVAITVLTSGCAPAPQRMSEPDRKAVRQATINPAVPKPPDVFYLGPGGGVGLMFGALGALATESARADARNSLRASGKLPVADKPGPGTATINLAIKQYGLSIPNGFSSNLVPILYLEAQMVDAAGKTVWSASDRVLTLGNPVEARPGEELRNDPKAIEAAWRAAAKHLSTSILKEL